MTTKRTRPTRQKLLTRRRLAAALSVTPMTITRWEADGMPVATRASRGKPTLFDRAAVDAWRTEVDQAKQAAVLSLSDERAKLAQRQREKIELDLAVRRGTLVEREAVLYEGQQYTKVWANEVRGLARRLVQAGVIAKEQEAGVGERCRALLDKIAEWKVPADERDEAVS